MWPTLDMGALQAAPAPAPAATPPSIAAANSNVGVSAQDAVVAALTGLPVLQHPAPAPEPEAGMARLLPASTQLSAAHPADVDADSAMSATEKVADVAAATAIAANAAPDAASPLTAGDIASTTVGAAGRDDEAGLDAEQLAAKWESENPWWDEAERQAQRQKAKLKVAAWDLPGASRTDAHRTQ